MAKVGILGQRHGNDGIKATDYTSPQSALGEHNVFKVVYKVPTDVKMAVVDVDLFIQTTDASGYAAVDISPTYTQIPTCSGVLVVGARLSNSGSVTSVEECTLNTFQRKCLVLGPGDTVFFRGPTDSNCVVTGIEHV